jgi:transposase-like protein
MSERRKYDAEFREGAVTIVRETGKPIAEVARDLGIGAGTLGSWVKKDRGMKTGLHDRLTAAQRDRLAPDTGPMTGSSNNQQPSTIRGEAHHFGCGRAKRGCPRSFGKRAQRGSPVRRRPPGIAQERARVLGSVPGSM